MLELARFFAWSGLLLSLNSLSAQNYPTDYFKSPLDVPLVLSGTFGELRSNHFHSGIDIKTQGKTGLDVKAAAEGQVVRIKVSPYGFGKAIYLRHPNGYTTVYAHLSKFTPAIEEFVKAKQYHGRTFAIELYPVPNQFTFEQGEVIAYSGNSGGSGGPHLHFEVRDTRTEDIINPLLFGFEVADTRTPDIYDLEVYEFDGEELVSNYTHDLLAQGNATYSLAGDEVLSISNMPAFGIRTTDRLNGASNRNGVYSIDLLLGSDTLYQFKMERFAFAESRYINSHIDFGLKKCCRRTINKLFIEPNNQFSAYPKTPRMNLPKLEKDSTYEVSVVVGDVAGNYSRLNFMMQRNADLTIQTSEPELPFSVFRYDQSNFYKKENIQLVLPEGALYSNIYFLYQRKEPCENCYSFVHQIGSDNIPIHKYFTLKIKPNEPFAGNKSQFVIMSMKDGEPLDYEGGEWDGEYVVARTRQFGDFAIMVDTLPPTAQTRGFDETKPISLSSSLNIQIDDDLSGIASYNGWINDQWQLFEYDAKNKLLTHDLAAGDYETGEHVLKLLLKDEVGNESEHNYHIILK